MLTRMTGKAPLIATIAALSLAACTTMREKPAPPAAPEPTKPASIKPALSPTPTPAKIRPRPTPRPAARPTPRPAPSNPATPTAIRANVVKEGNSLLVSRGPASQPVPLFRQAIVLAHVRAAVAGLPAQPKAEFQRGLLTLNFPAGTQPEVATAINRAIEIPEVTRLRANLPD